MNMPFYDNGFASGLLLGILFGFILEGAGLGSPRKLVAQFQLRDWTVFKVMFTAILVASAGLWLSEASGLIKANAVFVPTLYLWAVALGGVLIGAGFAIGGYCPGTSTVGFFTGRIDALVFMAGMIAGTTLFAALFQPLEGLYMAGQGPKGETVAALMGIPAWAVIVALALVGFAGFVLAERFERKHGGAISAENLSDAVPAPGE